MFLLGAMQASFDFAGADVRRWRDRLAAAGEWHLPPVRRAPIGQLVKSLISARTRDATSLAAYRRLGARYATAAALAGATPAAVEAIIADVTFADAKAAQLVAALRRIERVRPDFRLDVLAELPLAQALAWLERLPGVGRKVAASTLNASTLALPVMIVDTHVLRVLHRLGFVAPGAAYRAASEAVTAAGAGWTGDDFLAFHILAKRLGQTICRHDAPACASCPLADSCPTAQSSSATGLAAPAARAISRP